MKNFKKLVLTVALAMSLIGGSALAQTPAHTGKDQNGSFVSGQILVKPRAGVAEQVLQNIFSSEGARQGSAIDKINVRIVHVPDGKEQMIIDRLSKNPHIEFAELDRIIPPDFIPNDPEFSFQWHHSKIGSPAAWDNASADGITIAILDTGIDATHPDLAAALILPGWNVVSLNTDTSDIKGHGTMVSGTAAAVVNNATGVAGVARNAKILPVRISDRLDGLAFGSDIANGVIWAADNGAKIVNNSYAAWRGATVIAAADYLKSKGGLMVGSAGNENTLQSYEDSTIIVVSGTSSTDVKASFSNYGPMIDVAAPGDVVTTFKGGGYGGVNGTSFSAPITAGVLSLIMGANSALTANDVETILETTAVDLGDPGYDIYYGHGRVNAAAAVQMALAYTPPPVDTTPPSAAISAPTSGSTVAGTVVVDVTANDNIGVTKVNLYVNGAFYATDAMAPYSFAWDTTPLGNAPSVTLTAKASDAAGNTTTSSGVSVKVLNVVDTTPPAITISSPANGATVSGTVAITASATDNLGVSNMKLYIDGSLKAAASTSSFSYSWNTKHVTNGSHTITVEATDTSANTGQSIIQILKGGGSGGRK